MKDRKTIESEILKAIQEHFDAYSVNGRRMSAMISPTSVSLLVHKLAPIFEGAQFPKVRLPKIKLSIDRLRTATHEINCIIEDAESQIRAVCSDIIETPGKEPREIMQIFRELAGGHAYLEMVSSGDCSFDGLLQLQRFFDRAMMLKLTDFELLHPDFTVSDLVNALTKSDIFVWHENGSLVWEAVEEEQVEKIGKTSSEAGSERSDENEQSGSSKTQRDD